MTSAKKVKKPFPTKNAHRNLNAFVIFLLFEGFRVKIGLCWFQKCQKLTQPLKHQ